MRNTKILNKIKNQKGITLIEMLIYMGLLAILLVLLTEILVSTLNAHLESKTNTDVQQDGTFITTRMSYDLYNADNVTVPANPGNTSTTLEFTNAGNTYTYSENSNNLFLTEIGVESNQLNSSETTISNLSFQKIGNTGGKPSIKVQFTVTSTTTDQTGNKVQTYETTLGLR